MTRIVEIKLQNVRALAQIEICPGPFLNLIGGNNGAGKTSLLEAIYLAGRGRTFRHPDAGPLLRRGESDAQVVLKLEVGSPAGKSVLGIRRGKRDFECRFDGAAVNKRSELAAILPLLFVSSTPQGLVASGPEARRQFLDMAMFHVEPGYLQQYGVWLRTLRQRNAALAAGEQRSLASWDRHFVNASQAITTARMALVDVIAERVVTVLSEELLLPERPAFRYLRGWALGDDLEAALLRKRDLDLERGFTSVGPQRADMALSTDGQPVDKRLSRGQLKLLVIALNLALLDLVRERRGLDGVPLLLIDDLGSELDTENLRRVIAAIRARRIQSFAVLLDPTELVDATNNDKMFHVEHGTVTHVKPGIMCDHPPD